VDGANVVDAAAVVNAVVVVVSADVAAAVAAAVADVGRGVGAGLGPGVGEGVGEGLGFGAGSCGTAPLGPNCAPTCRWNSGGQVTARYLTVLGSPRFHPQEAKSLQPFWKAGGS